MSVSLIKFQVRIACIFGNLGNEALLVTNEDKVYGLGSNGAGCLGYGDMHSTLFPRKVEALCNKVSIRFICTLTVLFAYLMYFEVQYFLRSEKKADYNFLLSLCREY